MKRPSFQFYPADWRQNANLRRCSHGARGAWMDILCVLHDSDEYGLVRWPLAELARAAGVPLTLARELAAKGVLKGSDKSGASYVHTPRHAGKAGDPLTLVHSPDGPCWFSSRMVTDEWRRKVSGGSGRFSSTNPLTKPSTTPATTPRHGEPVGDTLGDGATSSSSSTSSEEETKKEGTAGAVPPAPRVEFQIPEWVPRKTWDAFVAMRKKQRKAPTDEAMRLIVLELSKLRAAGHDQEQVLNQSIRKGWLDVYAIKSERNDRGTGKAPANNSLSSHLGDLVRERAGEGGLGDGGQVIDGNAGAGSARSRGLQALLAGADDHQGGG